MERPFADVFCEGSPENQRKNRSRAREEGGEEPAKKAEKSHPPTARLSTVPHKMVTRCKEAPVRQGAMKERAVGP